MSARELQKAPVGQGPSIGSAGCRNREGGRGAVNEGCRTAVADRICKRQAGLFGAERLRRHETFDPGAVVRVDRKSVVWGKSVSARVDLGGPSRSKKKIKQR